MLSFPAAIKVYLCTVPCDMRRSFDGLSMMAEHGWRRAHFNFLFQRRDGRRSLPGNPACYWKGSI